MKYAICLASLILVMPSFAQKRPFKFGKVSMDELNMEQCEFYPDAHSMILGSWGVLTFEYDQDEGFIYHLTITTRKKVFDLTDTDAGNFRIMYYNPVNSGSDESVESIKGNTYNLVDGKIVKEKLANSEEFTNRVNDYWEEKTFALPQVKEGTVVEYRYEVISPYISTLRTWHFQQDIPVAYSEFKYTIPEYFNYQASQVGHIIPLSDNEEFRQETFTYEWESSTANLGGRTQKGTGSLNSNSKLRRLVAQNIPPVIDEPHMNNRKNVPSRIEFQLVSTQYPNSPMKMVASNYNSFNETMMKSSRFGLRLNKGGFAKEFIAGLSGTEVEKSNAILKWIRKNIAWNEYNAYTSETAGRPAFNQETGNVADINLTLVAVLREAGLNAHPIILSTRGNGMLHPVYPNNGAFNYVVASVLIGDELFFADATSKLSFGMLPTKCLNDRGWMVTESGGQWVDLKSRAYSEYIAMTNIEFVEGEMIAKVTSSSKGYQAFYYNGDYEEKGEDQFIEDLATDLEDWDLTDFSFDNSGGEAVKIGFQLSQEVDDYIFYLNPFFQKAVTENPFKREERYSTIDYAFRHSYRHITTIDLPSGYSCELPDPVNVVLPNNGAKYRYMAQQTGNRISLMAQYELNQTTFSPNEYDLIKQFFQIVVEKNNQSLVLKKS